MKEKRSIISDLFHFLFILAGCALFGYMVLGAINVARWFHWAYIFSLVVVLPAFCYSVYALYCSLKLIMEDLHADKEN